MSGFTECRLPTADGYVYVRDYAGNCPAFMMHGFPDNGHIYDNLIPHLVAGGRRAITIDFLGFGASDKPAGAVQLRPPSSAAMSKPCSMPCSSNRSSPLALDHVEALRGAGTVVRYAAGTFLARQGTPADRFTI